MDQLSAYGYDKSDQEMEEARRKIKTYEETIVILKKQIHSQAIDFNKKNNELQNQLQGVEAVSKSFTLFKKS